MKQKELMSLIAGGENEGVEFKSAFGDAVIEALVAFANTSGGRVLVGVDDHGNIPGIMMGKETIPKWRYGSGIKRAVEELTDYKLPVPKIVETAGGIEIVIYGTPQEKKEHQKNGGINGGLNGGLNGGINGGLNILCEYIKNNPGKRITEISAILQIPESTLEKQAKKLKDLGKITYKGSKKKGGYYVTRKGTG